MASDKVINVTDSAFESTVVNGGMPCLVDFWAPWCGPCKLMAPILNDIAESENNKVTIDKINVDIQKQLASQFKIRSIPTLIVFKNGKELKRFTGFKTKSFIMGEISKLKQITV